MPLLAAVPFLFVSGVLFGYFVVLPAAVRFFVNFNAGEFNVLVQASQFYGFATTVLLAMGLIFQVPVAIVGATRLGLVTPRQLRKNRRYAIVACAVIAALLPGDAITLALRRSRSMCSMRRVSWWHRLSGERTAARPTGPARAPAPRGDPAPPTNDQAEPTVQDIIDHVDESL